MFSFFMKKCSVLPLGTSFSFCNSIGKREAIRAVSAYAMSHGGRNRPAAHNRLFRVQLRPLLPGGVRNLCESMGADEPPQGDPSMAGCVKASRPERAFVRSESIAHNVFLPSKHARINFLSTRRIKRWQHKRSRTESKFASVQMQKLFDRYVEEYIPVLSPRVQRDYASIMKHLRQEFGEMDSHEIKPRHIVAFLNVKKGKIHRNRMVMILSTVFHKAIYAWCIDDNLRNPCTGVQRHPTRPRDRYITDDEYERFRAICCPSLQIAMDLALLTGQRQGDIIGMRWDQIKEDSEGRSYIQIDQGKTGKKLAIMISPAVEAVLDRAWTLPPMSPKVYVIRTNPRSGPKGGRYTPDGFRAMFQRYMRLWMKSGEENAHFHDLRAKAISDNKNFDAAYLLAGHISPTITRRTYDRARRVVQPLR